VSRTWLDESARMKRRLAVLEPDRDAGLLLSPSSTRGLIGWIDRV